MAKQKKIAVTGASGLIGSALCAQLKSEGHQVIKVVRRAARVADEVSWNPLKGEIDLAGLEGADPVFHLAGAGVGDKRWSAAFRSEILNSRLLSTTTIANACERIQPEVFISASAIGFYTSCESICALFASIIAGALWTNFGSTSTCISTACISLLVFLYFLLRIKKRDAE